MGKKKKDEYEQAYDLYCNSGLTQKQICEVVKVSPQQVSKWANTNNWELDKTAQQVTAPKLIREWYASIAMINKIANDEKRPLNISEINGISQITNNIEKIQKKSNLSVYHRVLREFLEWEMKTDHEKAKLFAPEMFEFLTLKSKELNAQ